MNIPLRRWADIEESDRGRLLSRSGENIKDVLDSVADIVEAVRREGDAALAEYSRRFDKIDLSERGVAVTDEELLAADASVSPELRAAIDFSIENVRRFHLAQLEHGPNFLSVRPGIIAGERTTAIDSVGLYVPRGRGTFPSMLYMLAVPASVAGVPHIAVTTPAGPDGFVDPACLYAAKSCGVHSVYRVGGAQAVAALAYGTESVRRTIKIVGPGSAYVAAAKQLVRDVCDVGLPAGPSESIVIADGAADPWKVSLDLLIEAEHGADSQAILITPSRAIAESVAEIVPELIGDLPEPRKEFATNVITGYGGIILVDDLDEAAAVSNRFAPEHLQLQVAEPFDLLEKITNAGEILLGDRTPFSAANYATGANAVLPTGGYAKTFSPVGVRDFTKRSSVVYMTEQGYSTVEPHVLALADHEGFPAHAAAFRRRFQNDTD